MMTDPIADMLARLKNAMQVRKPDVVVPFSKLKWQLAQILADEGYVGAVEETKDSGKPEIRIELKYNGNTPIIRHIKRVSTPGRRVYVGADQLPYVYDNLGIAIVSTSQGLMTNKKARSQRIGGEVVCEIF
jgi:small subunit ribosomal protein S8